MPDIYSFGTEPVSCHCWNKDRSRLALSPNNHELYIYKLVGGKWVVEDTLSEHSQRITSVDWAPNTNRIVTCGTDRNAYVWTQQSDGKWKPWLVILRTNRAATSVAWSPLENKFAVATGARVVCICYFEKENDWWVSKHIKKPIRSTVTSLDWHPNNILIACGSTDFKARVFSSYVKEVDEKPGPNSWGSKMPFGNLMGEFSIPGGGWVHDISFSGSGDRLAFVAHNSSVSVVDSIQGMKLCTLKTEQLPFMAVTWITENSMVVAGYDCCPILFTFTGSEVKFGAKLDESGSKQQKGGKFSAKSHFQNLDSRAQTAEGTDTVLDTSHQNTITQLSIHSGTKAKCAKFTTSSVDGQVIVWDVKSLESAVAGLRIS